MANNFYKHLQQHWKFHLLLILIQLILVALAAASVIQFVAASISALENLEESSILSIKSALFTNTTILLISLLALFIFGDSLPVALIRHNVLSPNRTPWSNHLLLSYLYTCLRLFIAFSFVSLILYLALSLWPPDQYVIAASSEGSSLADLLGHWYFIGLGLIFTLMYLSAISWGYFHSSIRQPFFWFFSLAFTFLWAALTYLIYYANSALYDLSYIKLSLLPIFLGIIIFVALRTYFIFTILASKIHHQNL